MGWTLTNFRTYLRFHLKDSGSVWSQDEIDRCVHHALADFGRFYPRERIYEARVDSDVITTESVTLVSGAKSLTYKPVKWASEVVLDTDGTACVRGTDYEMDYANGEITYIAGGEIASDTETISVTYTRCNIAIDISGLTMQRVFKVEYPIGEIPQDFVTYMVFGGNLYITSKKGGQGQSQSNLVDNKQARVYYYSPHTRAESTASGTAPDWSDEIVLKGAEAYAYLIEAGQYTQQAITDFASARGAIDEEVSAVHTLLAAAIAAVKTECESANSALDSLDITDATGSLSEASTALGLIATGDDHHALADTALDAAVLELTRMLVADTDNSNLYHSLQVEDTTKTNPGAVFLSNAATNAISSEAYLTEGDATIPTVNKGEDVAPLYMQYAEAVGKIHDRLRDQGRLHLERAGVQAQIVTGFIQEAQGRLSHIALRVQEAQSEAAVGNGYSATNANTLRQCEAYVANAQTYARQAEGYVQQISVYLQEADRYTVLAMQNIELAASYREFGILRRNEFWAIIGDRTQSNIRGATASGNQMPSSG